MTEQAERLRALRDIAAYPRREAQRAPPIALGEVAFDEAIGGGWARGQLHELTAADPRDAAAACAFAAILARLAAEAKPWLWLRTERAARAQGQLHAPGLAELGIDPATLLVGTVADDVALLGAAIDAARCAALGAVVCEHWRNPSALDLTAGRRLLLAAERSGVTLIQLRIEAKPAASAAHSRWAVRAAPSAELAANAPGAPAFEVELLRRRGGAAGGIWTLEWDRDAAAFRRPALSRAQLPVPARRAVADPPAWTWRRAG